MTDLLPVTQEDRDLVFDWLMLSTPEQFRDQIRGNVDRGEYDEMPMMQLAVFARHRPAKPDAEPDQCSACNGTTFAPVHDGGWRCVNCKRVTDAEPGEAEHLDNLFAEMDADPNHEAWPYFAEPGEGDKPVAERGDMLLMGLLRREGRHSGVWFAHKLLEAADRIEALASRPTMDAYLRACRALHWHTAQLRANGIEPDPIPADAPHYPPDDHVFSARPTPAAPDDVVERVKAALLAANVNAYPLENPDALAKAAIAAIGAGERGEVGEIVAWLRRSSMEHEGIVERNTGNSETIHLSMAAALRDAADAIEQGRHRK